MLHTAKKPIDISEENIIQPAIPIPLTIVQKDTKI